MATRSAPLKAELFKLDVPATTGLLGRVFWAWLRGGKRFTLRLPRHYVEARIMQHKNRETRRAFKKG